MDSKQDFWLPWWFSGKKICMQAGDPEDMSLIPGLEDPLEKGTATHWSILARKILWTEKDTVHGVANG